MPVKQMLRYWAEEGVLVRNDEMIILKGVHGPEEYNYFVLLEEADVELEFIFKSTRRELLTEGAARIFERGLVKILEKMQGELKNEEPPPQQWRNRKK